MTRRSPAQLSRALSLTLLASMLVFVVSTPALAASNHKIVGGYFEEWSIYGAGYDLDQVQTAGIAKNLDILTYAFGNAYNSNTGVGGTCNLADPWADFGSPFVNEVPGATPWTPVTQTFWTYQNTNGNFADLLQLKQLNPNLKVVISVGGANPAQAAGFAQAAATDAGRKALVSSCINLFIDPASDMVAAAKAEGFGGYGGTAPLGPVFDGIDIDWEFPTAADKANFTLLMQEFRKELDAFGAAHGGKHYLLTYFGPAGKQNYSNIDIAGVAKSVDFVNLQGYDFHGTWETQTDHAAPLFQNPHDPHLSDPSEAGFYDEGAVDAFLDGGTPGSKILLGIPLYARGWAGVPNVNHGLFQTSTGPAPAPGDELATDGVSTVDWIAANNNGFTTYLDPFALVNWEYNPATQTFWSYETTESAAIKSIYSDVRVPGGLGGEYVWAIKDQKSGAIIQTMRNYLKP